MKPTIDELKKLLGIANSEQSLPDPSEETEADPSTRPIWTKPIPKLVVGTILLMPVFIVAGSFLVGTHSVSENPSTANSTQPNTNEGLAGTETEALRQENARLKAKAALEGQQQLEKQLTAKPKSKVSIQKKSPTPAKSPAVIPKTPTSSIAVQPAAPRLVSAPVPRPEPIAIHSTDFSHPGSVSKARIQPEAENPEQRWQQLAQLGSYGSAPESLMQPEQSQSNQTAVLSKETATNPDLEPEIGIRATRNSEEDADISAIDETQARPLSQKDSINSEDNSLPILEAAESKILNADASPINALVAGSRSSGVLVTPLILDETRADSAARDRRTQFTVTLTQPLRDTTGNTVLPTNTQLSIRVDDVSATGRVKLSAIAATWTQDGATQSITLPADAIQIRADDGQPLIAQATENKGKEIAALDAGQFLLGAVREASGQFTRSNTRVQTGNGATIVTQDNQRPNILAGALKGGTDAILDSIAERNRRAVEAIQARPVTRWIEAGQSVQVFVNQTLQIRS